MGCTMRRESLSRRERCGARRKLPVRAGIYDRERNVLVDLRLGKLICSEAFRTSGSDHMPRQRSRTIGVLGLI